MDYISLQADPPSIFARNPLKRTIRTAFGVAGILTLLTTGLRSFISRSDPNASMKNTSRKAGSRDASSAISSGSPFYPKEGIDKVLLQPAAPSLLALPLFAPTPPRCVFAYGQYVQCIQDCKQLQTQPEPSREDALLYGATLPPHDYAGPGAYPLALPTRQAKDVLNGVLFCWANGPVGSSALCALDELFAFDSKRPDAAVQRVVARAVRRDGSSQPAYTYLQASSVSEAPRSSASSSEHAPEHWQEVWSAIERMRSARDAPVDTMGCAELGDRESTPADFRFQVLVGLMLSAQTKDEVTAAAVGRLKQFYASEQGGGEGLTAKSVARTEENQLMTLIYPVSFHKRKAHYLQKTAQILQDTLAGDIPPDVKGLCSLPGVGPKMAFLAMQTAWCENVGIGVDVHVHRISNRLGWAGKNGTKQPEQTRERLEAWLPKDKWNAINGLLVGFGQQRCSARSPACSDCLALPYCPFGTARLNEKP
eukprot:g81533.t1